jgi:putative SOS response-associated peptidase YedK
MPDILRPEAYGPWLNPNNQDANSLQTIIQNQIYTELTSVPVSKQVNAARNNNPSNLKPVQTEFKF